MLDAFTLVVCTTLINATMIVTLLALYRTSPSEMSILDWLGGICCFFCSNIFGLFVAITASKHWVLPALANSFFVAGNALILSALYRYLRGRRLNRLVIMTTAVTFIAHLHPFAQQSTENRILILYPLIIVLCISTVATLLHRQFKPRIFGLLPLTIVIAAFTVQLIVRLTALVLSEIGLPVFNHEFIVNSGTLGVMLYVMALAMSVAYLVNWAREQHLEKVSNTDTLTGWFNRRAFTSRMPELFDLTRRLHQPFVCIVMDIDFFKQVNDTYGHTVGDEVLIHVSHQMRRVTRDCEFYYRLGGEEFVLLLPNYDSKQAMSVAERVRTTVEASPYIHGGKELHCSVSLGVAVMPAYKEGKWETLLQGADNALYKAKASGRNTTCLDVLSHQPQGPVSISTYQVNRNLSA